ncbi:MAG: hypothetical protein WC971_06530 [Coriobacteriia bacterium]
MTQSNRPTRRGRPSKYSPALCERVESTAEHGATLVQIAVACDVCTSTVKTWMREFPEFSAAVTRARARADAPVESALYHAALSGDNVAIKIWLSNRRPHEWSDAKRVEVKRAGGGAIEYANVSDADLIAEAEAIIGASKARASADDARVRLTSAVDRIAGATIDPRMLSDGVLDALEAATVDE